MGKKERGERSLDVDGVMLYSIGEGVFKGLMM